MNESFEDKFRIVENELLDLRVELDSCRRMVGELQQEIMQADQWMYRLAAALKLLDPRSPVLSEYYQRVK